MSIKTLKMIAICFIISCLFVSNSKAQFSWEEDSHYLQIINYSLSISENADQASDSDDSTSLDVIESYLSTSASSPYNGDIEAISSMSVCIDPSYDSMFGGGFNYMAGSLGITTSNPYISISSEAAQWGCVTNKAKLTGPSGQSTTASALVDLTWGTSGDGTVTYFWHENRIQADLNFGDAILGVLGGPNTYVEAYGQNSQGNFYKVSATAMNSTAGAFAIEGNEFTGTVQVGQTCQIGIVAASMVYVGEIIQNMFVVGSMYMGTIDIGLDQ